MAVLLAHNMKSLISLQGGLAQPKTQNLFLATNPQCRVQHAQTSEGQSLGRNSQGEKELQLSLCPMVLDTRMLMGISKEGGISIVSTGTKAISPLPTIIQNWTERFWHFPIGVTHTAP